ncbi:unnamed protein product [Fraxinus pennsylvanica]|uniref:Serine-threonine/tyrosine-protein kinase catalytic domain-containing protein n=1 Tax=Fraxinus pennsylvanica TaxID=56036 RepID=A0AAD1YP79_9LAMI|nr:unnamed protein product [Fraxinus pennsylvanica]
MVDKGFGLELEYLSRASAHVVGKSRSGIVYKLVVGGGVKGGGAGVGGPVVVAARRFCEEDATWGFKELESEMEAMFRVQHCNIARLRAYYYASYEKLLVSDFICNESLYCALHVAAANGVVFKPLQVVSDTGREVLEAMGLKWRQPDFGRSVLGNPCLDRA